MEKTLMKFILADTPRYWWPVVVKMPDTDNPGQFVELSFKVLFEPRDQDAEVAERARVLAILDAEEQLKEDRMSLAAVIKDWDEIVDTDKTPVPFTAAKVDQMLRQPWARMAVWTAYHESMAGGAHLGN